MRDDLDDSIVPEPTSEIDDALGTPLTVIQARPTVARETCGFVNTETKQNCRNPAAYVVTMPPVCTNLFVCGLHVRAFWQRAGASIRKVGGAR